VNRAITQVDADAFAAHMCRRFGALILRKSERSEAQIVANFFELIHSFKPDFMSGDDFMRAATTIGTWIYLPDGLSPEQQIELLTHEMQHVVQFAKGGAHTGLAGGLGMWWLYTSQTEARLRYEIEALAAGYEVAFRRHGTIPSLESIAIPLEGGYLFTSEQIAHARRLLESRITSLVATSKASTEAGQAAVEWLERMGLVAQ